MRSKQTQGNEREADTEVQISAIVAQREKRCDTLERRRIKKQGDI